MKLLRIMGMGLLGLFGKPFRTALAALGIVIGVGAVVTLTSLGNGIQNSVAGQITDLGPNLITVSPGGESEDGGPSGGGPLGAAAASTLTPEDTQRVREIPSVAAASSNISTSGLADGESLQFSGVDPSYPEVRSIALASGRFLEGDGEVVLSKTAARDLLDSSPEEAVGQTIEVRGSAQQPEAEADAPENPPEDLPEGVPEGVPEEARDALWESGGDPSSGNSSDGESTEPAGESEEPAREFEVVGVAEEESAGFGPPVPATSYVSTSEAQGLSGSRSVGQILVSANDENAVASAKDGITREIRENHGGQEDFTVITQEELLSAFDEISSQLNIFLAGIAGISLLVGGIGIMNIMLVSVAERTREIGIRKALGATDSDVLFQFLFESVMLAVLGGAAGIALGVAASELMPRFLEDLPEAVFGAGQIGLAFGVSALIGVVFGSLPAYRSARLAPVEALRRE